MKGEFVGREVVSLKFKKKIISKSNQMYPKFREIIIRFYSCVETQDHLIHPLINTLFSTLSLIVIFSYNLSFRVRFYILSYKIYINETSIKCVY